MFSNNLSSNISTNIPFSISCGELFERISEDSYTLTEAKGITYMKQICTAIQYMHSLNILHLDLKAENILCVSVNSEDIKVGVSERIYVCSQNSGKFIHLLYYWIFNMYCILGCIINIVLYKVNIFYYLCNCEYYIYWLKFVYIINFQYVKIYFNMK